MLLNTHTREIHDLPASSSILGLVLIQSCTSTIAATVFSNDCANTVINTLLISFLLLRHSSGYCFQSGVTAQFYPITASVGCSIDSGCGHSRGLVVAPEGSYGLTNI